MFTYSICVGTYSTAQTPTFFLSVISIPILSTNMMSPSISPYFITMLVFALYKWIVTLLVDFIAQHALNCANNHRLKRIGHRIPSAIQNLVIQWFNALDRAIRHSVESEPLAAFQGEARASRVSG